MQENREKHQLRKAFMSSLPQIVVVAVGIVLFFAFYKFREIVAALKSFCAILMPIFVGLVLAYLTHPVVERFERLIGKIWTRWWKKEVKKKKAFRLPAILLTFILFGWIIYLLGSMVVPELYSNISKIIYAVPGQMTKYYNLLIGLISDNSWISDIVDRAYNSIMEFLTGWMRNEMFSQISVLINGVFSVVGAMSNVLIGCIVAIYLLFSKETFTRQFNLILKAFFPERAAVQIKEIISEVDRIFGGFISGKIIDSLIIGVLCFLGATILNLPYVVLISVIVGVTNIIPFFGPYIGAVPSAILILLDSPTKGLIFIIFIVILQQFDGNILGPKILGDSTGLSPFWVIFAIVVGSGLFGLVGMLIGVPAFAVVYYLAKRYIYYRLNRQKSDKQE